jgi:hypothetical protein
MWITVSINHDIQGVQATVDLAMMMGMLQALGNLPEDIRDAQGTHHSLCVPECHAFYLFLDDEKRALLLDDFMHFNEVRMFYSGCGPGIGKALPERTAHSAWNIATLFAHADHDSTPGALLLCEE